MAVRFTPCKVARDHDDTALHVDPDSTETSTTLARDQPESTSTCLLTTYCGYPKEKEGGKIHRDPGNPWEFPSL